MDQNSLPLYDALIKHNRKSRFSFHVPGHKNGTVFNSRGAGLFRRLLKIDVTELTGLDDLHNTTGVLKDAEQLAAQLYGSDDCFFLVGGTTVGNIAMIMATCKVDDTVLVQRNSHKSILNALELAKVNPVFLQPCFDNDAQIATCIDEAHVIESIKKYPSAKAVILTNPNYYGFTINIETIVKIAHQHQIAVLVDEAHGAHFGHKSNLIPNSAVNQGADIVIQSAHKTLPAMTMSSFLHFNSQLVDIDALKYYLQLFQSSSPSYPLLASLDLARHFLANLSETELNITIEQLKAFKKAINAIPQLKVIDSDQYVIDPFKITIQSQCQLNGFQLQDLLEQEGIYVELADQYNILLVLSLVTKTNELLVVAKILQKLVSKYRKMPIVKRLHQNINKSRTRLAISYKEMEGRETDIVGLDDSVGEIISKEIIPYPPGIPLLLRGERVSDEHIRALYDLKRAGAYFQGDDIFQNGMRVFKKR